MQDVCCGGAAKQVPITVTPLALQSQSLHPYNPHPYNPHPSYNRVALEIVSKFRYLGVYLSSSIGIGETFQHLHHRMQGSWALMAHCYRNLRSAASVGLLRRFFLACVVSSGSYACEVWGFRFFPPASHSHSKASITTAYLSMLRQLAGVRPTVATPILLAELSVQQLEDIWLKTCGNVLELHYSLT